MVDHKKHAGNLIKRKTFHNLKLKVYPYEKGVIRDRELSLVTPEENNVLGKKGIMDYKKITIRRSGKEI